MTRPITIFYVYAETDEALRQKVDLHLALLKRQGVLTSWQESLAGALWEQERAQAFKETSLILLLISADFLASDVCYKEQMQQALERERQGAVKVIPILLRPVDWKSAPFAHLQVLPNNEKPITSWANEDEAFAYITEGIRCVLEDKPLPSPAPENLPPPEAKRVWMVPYARNPFFTGRDAMLDDLHQRFKQGQVVPQAITGLGGIGKTQTAVEYAYRYHQEYQAVLWMRADSEQNIVSSMMRMAIELHLPEREEKETEQIIAAVKRWWHTHTGWLLVVDNADELVLLHEMLPQMGQVLLTTRSSVTRGVAEAIVLPVLPEEEGMLLLLRCAKVLSQNQLLEVVADVDRAEARQITQDVGGLPLALDQAGAYIEETACSLAEYRALYQQRYRSELLKRRGTLSGDYLESVATTWSISFEQVERKSPAAAELLRVCAFLAPDVIPERIITQGASHLGQLLANVSVDRFLLGQTIEALRAYSLIQRDPRTQTLSVHRLVQAVLRNSMAAEADKEWKLRVVRAVDASSPDVKDVTQWNACEQWLPHALLCATWIVQEDMSIPEALRILNHAGIYLDDHARYAEAEPLYRRALAICEKQLGSHHPDTAMSLNNLAYLYNAQGRYAEAEPLYRRALAIYEEQLSPHHLDLAGSMSNLAMLYQTQGKHTEAEPFLMRALAIYEEQLGPHHPDTAMSLNNLAYLYNAQKKYAEAESLYRRALAIYEEQLGAHHPNTAKSLNNLAALYYAQEKYAEAEPLYRRALAIYEEQLGPHHPDLAGGLNNLAMLYNAQRRYAEAEPLYRRALAIYEEQLGPHHLDTARILYTMATLYYAQGKHAEAEPFLKRVLEIYEQVGGADHPDTVIIRGNYADLLGQLEADGT